MGTLYVHVHGNLAPPLFSTISNIPLLGFSFLSFFSRIFLCGPFRLSLSPLGWDQEHLITFAAHHHELWYHLLGNSTKNSNLWETKQLEKTHVKENNHTHKTIFTWFGNLPTSTELQGFHYKIRRYNSAQEHSQETQFPIHPNSLSPTRQENTILSSYAAARLLGIISHSYT